MIAPALLLAAALAGADQPSACVVCHTGLAEKYPELAAPAQAVAEDVHRSNGIGCHDCHGGNPGAPPDKHRAAHDEDDFGFIGAPAPGEVPDLCGRCHSDIDYMRRFNPRARVDQLGEYRRSVHGIKGAAGDENVANCISCHGAHGVLPVQNPLAPTHPRNVAATCGKCHSDGKRMAEYGIPTDQQRLWEESVHGKTVAKGDFAAPSCNGCHGNHGAAPPGVASIVNVCGQCHAREATLFAASPLHDPWAKLGLPECIKCHGNHAVGKPSDLMVGGESPALCVTCHEHGREGLGVATRVRSSYEELHRAIDEAGATLGHAARLGMEVSREQYALTEAQDRLIDARVLIHSFDAAKVREEVDKGLGIARTARAAGEAALAEHEERKHGLLVSLAFILAAILGLWLKIRDLERPQA